MYQSVMAQRQGTGSSGIGFAFALVDVKEVHPDQNICLVSDTQTGAYQQLGLDKRGSTEWPQVGDRWIMDRSLGHWALRCKITATSAPVVTGSKNAISAPGQALLGVLEGLGLIDDQTTAQTVPVGVWQIPSALTLPFSDYGGDYQAVRYMIEESGFVSIEGLVKTSAAISGANPVFTLPLGFRPLKHQTFSSQANGTLCLELQVMQDGTVRLMNVPAATTISFASMSCRFSVL